MTKSKSSDMIRVVNDLVPDVKKLNELYRAGYAEAILKGMQCLIEAIERGESFGDVTIAHRLSQLERLVAIPRSLAEPIVPTVSMPQEPAFETLTEAEVCERFKVIGLWWERAHQEQRTPEHYLESVTGCTYLGLGRFKCPQR